MNEAIVPEGYVPDRKAEVARAREHCSILFDRLVCFLFELALVSIEDN